MYIVSTDSYQIVFLIHKAEILAFRVEESHGHILKQMIKAKSTILCKSMYCGS